METPLLPKAAALFARIDRPLPVITADCLGADFVQQLRTTSGLWFRCGYRPGIAAYLGFFLLRDFVVLHDERAPARFATLQAMAKSFYETDLFIRAVTDSGREPTGGISSPRVRALLRQIMARHEAARIPDWAMTWFGWTLFENVERQCAPLTEEQRRLHLAYMTTTYRMMGVPFSTDRALMTAFARAVEVQYAGGAPQLEKHARAILRIGEMIGVSSAPESLLPMLPDATRELFAPMAKRVRPGAMQRAWLRVLGRVVVPRAVGATRVAEPFVAPA